MKKYFFFLLLSVSIVYGQDTLKLKLKKNYFGISVSPAIIGSINTSAYGSSLYDPFFTTSFYFEYNRVLSKRVWLTGGIGTFVNGYNYSIHSVEFKDNVDPVYSYPNFNSILYNYNFSIQVKPKYIISDKKFLFYMGLLAQMNFYLTSFSVVKYYDNNGKFIDSKSGFHNDLGTGSIYGGIISGIGYRYKRFLFTAEPEFKLNISTVINNYSTYDHYISYSLGINLLAYYNF